MANSFNVKKGQITVRLSAEQYKAFVEGRTSMEVYLPWTSQWKNRLVENREEAMKYQVVVTSKDKEPLRYGICFISWRFVSVHRHEPVKKHIVLMLRK